MYIQDLLFIHVKKKEKKRVDIHMTKIRLNIRKGLCHGDIII
jgi:hypothetical protein